MKAQNISGPCEVWELLECRQRAGVALASEPQVAQRPAERARFSAIVTGMGGLWPQPHGQRYVFLHHVRDEAGGAVVHGRFRFRDETACCAEGWKGAIRFFLLCRSPFRAA